MEIANDLLSTALIALFILALVGAPLYIALRYAFKHDHDRDKPVHH